MKFDIKYINKNKKGITEKLNENIIIHKDLYDKINNLKEQIDNIPNKKWRLIRTIVTDYEFVSNNNYHKIKCLKSITPISRAYFKLWEILIKFESQFDLQNLKNITYIGLAEAPGGFIKCFLDYRKKFNHYNDKIIGISLKHEGEIDKKIDWIIKNNNLEIVYGDKNKNHNGDLLNPEILKYFCNKYNNSADFVTADGGFALNDNIKERNKGQYHCNLFLCEIFAALNVLKNGGKFIIKIYDFSNKVTIDLINVLNKVFKFVKIIKPKTSREMNNENYIVCNYYYKNKKIINILWLIIKKLWNNKNLLINNILEYNDDELLNKLLIINKMKINKQYKKIEYALLLKDKTEKDLKNIFKIKYNYKISLVYKWIKNYNFCFEEN